MKRPLAILAAASLALALFAAAPAAAGEDVECTATATSGNVIGSNFGVTAASASIGGQAAVQKASNFNFQRNNFAVDSGSGSATTMVSSQQYVDQDVDQEICED